MSWYWGILQYTFQTQGSLLFASVTFSINYVLLSKMDVVENSADREMRVVGGERRVELHLIVCLLCRLSPRVCFSAFVDYIRENHWYLL